MPTPKPMHAPANPADSVSVPPDALVRRIRAAIAAAGGWLPFDDFMALALYAPGLGYYAHAGRKFGWLPESGSDFVTAPELTALFGQTLAAQVAQALDASATNAVYEFGAGSGALAEQVLGELARLGREPDYAIIDLSATLRERQQQRLHRFGARVRWLDTWPDVLRGVVLGNEVLDAMPVKLLHFDAAQWFERGVTTAADAGAGADAAPGVSRPFIFADRPTALRPPRPADFAPGYHTEIHPQAEAFVASLAARLQAGVALFIDYGFPEAEYYHPQRSGGTLMCHRAHRADSDPLAAVGEKDITAHVNFTAIALAAQNAGLDVLGYTSQARFLLNCGLAEKLDAAGARADVRERSLAHRLVAEHEMGELFKVIALGAPGLDFAPLGFAAGDRTHRL